MVVRIFGSTTGIQGESGILNIPQGTAQTCPARTVPHPTPFLDVLSDIHLGETSVYNCLSLELNSVYT